VLFPKKKVSSIFSIIAYSTYSVYLFHRVFLIIYTFTLTNVLQIDIRERDNLYLVLLLVPFIFLFSFLIQKAVDWVLNLPSRYKSINAINKE
jgi:cellulose synthase/poly-beta-1,6-N-acetylglucosamine synthase-like glycosyltransferase